MESAALLEFPPPWVDGGIEVSTPKGAHRCKVPYLDDEEDVEMVVGEKLAFDEVYPRRLTWGLPEMDAFLDGLVPGELGVVIARAEGGKSSCLMNLAHQACRSIVERGRRGKEVVIYFAAEDRLHTVAKWISGKTGKPSGPFMVLDGRHRTPGGVLVPGRPRQTLDEMIASANHACEERGLVPAAMFADYIGYFQTSATKDDKEGGVVSKFVESARLLIEEADRWKIPVVAGAQANRDGAGGIPRAEHVYGADNLYFMCATMFSLWDISKDFSTGDEESVQLRKKQSIMRIENSVWVEILKHRGHGRGGRLVYRDPNTRRFSYVFKKEEYTL